MRGEGKGKFKFSSAALSALPAPSSGRAHYYDTESPGLELVKTAKGVSSFYTLRWMREANKPVRVFIGSTAEVSISGAREKNAQNVSQILKGINPNQAKRAKREELTLGELWGRLLESCYQGKEAQSTCSGYQRIFDRHLKDWSKRRLSEISESDIKNLQLKVAQSHGPHAANNVLRFLRAFFNKAKAYGFNGENPCLKVALFKTVPPRTRVLQGPEIGLFLEAVKAESNPTARDIILLLLYTGQRKRDVCSMKWQDIDFESRKWRFQMRAKDAPQSVPLTAEALGVLKARERGESPWVFPGAGDKKRHFVNLKKAWARILKRSGLFDLRPHDLRRFYGSLLFQSGASLFLVQKALGHKSEQTTRFYARLSPDPLRAAAELAAKELIRQSGGGPAGKVVPLSRP